MSTFSDEDIKKLALLCRLTLTDEEVKKYKQELTDILAYVERLQDVDVTGLEPTSQVTGLVNVVRTDEEIDYDTTPEVLLENAPAVESNQFKVKRMVA